MLQTWINTHCCLIGCDVGLFAVMGSGLLTVHCSQFNMCCMYHTMKMLPVLRLVVITVLFFNQKYNCFDNWCIVMCRNVQHLKSVFSSYLSVKDGQKENKTI